MKKYRRESQTLLLFDYLRQHPGMAFSISYSLLTLCGILYSVSFYREFDIDILKLANVSDLLISGLSEPAALLMFFGGIVMGVSFDFVSQYTAKTQDAWRDRPNSIKRALVMGLAYTPKHSISILLTSVMIFILYAYAFVSSFAQWHSKHIKQGGGDKLTIASRALGLEAKEFTLLGSTTRYLLTFNSQDKTVAIIPVEKIDMLAAIKPKPEE